ncbi:UDP-N-acetylglucosamine 1-carboxyvinyltransferase [candidate division WOR-3 bacterium]|nr:UDP-N-acetylglucosamine 1-carboxyvinyltransferase [candidate division WOR-3 bacterium]
MDKFIIEGGKSLHGDVYINGAKNSALPILAATLLTENEFTINNVPMLRDIYTMKDVLETLGVSISIENNIAYIDTRGAVGYEAPYELIKRMRASYYVLGPLLSRLGKARVSLPGGCAIGPRPVDLHIKGLEALGADVSIVHGYIEAYGDNLRGSHILLEGANGPSVGATINTMMASVYADGVTVIEGAAMEPEVVDVANFLNCCKADISGQGTRRIEIRGIKELSGCEYSIIPDRIEAGTFAVAAAITRGDVRIFSIEENHLDAVFSKLREAGVEITKEEKGVRVRMDGDIMPIDIETASYPGFPTDMQAQITSLLSLSKGVSVVREAVFEGRFMHVPELVRMGANLRAESDYVIIKGVPYLSGAPVMSSDLRGSAALVLAGLAAQGTTDVSRIYHIDRGYETIEERLQSLGGEIWRLKE